MRFHSTTECKLRSISLCFYSSHLQVMWVRRTSDKFSLLTVGNITYSGDPRIKITFQYPNNWRLHIKPMQKDDAGLYMCQVSTHPPRVFATNVVVLRKYFHSFNIWSWFPTCSHTHTHSPCIWCEIGDDDPRLWFLECWWTDSDGRRDARTPSPVCCSGQKGDAAQVSLTQTLTRTIIIIIVGNVNTAAMDGMHISPCIISSTSYHSNMLASRYTHSQPGSRIVGKWVDFGSRLYV